MPCSSAFLSLFINNVRDFSSPVMGTKGTKFKLITPGGGLQPPVAVHQAVTFYLSQAERGSIAVMKRVLESHLGTPWHCLGLCMALSRHGTPMSLSVKIT